MLHAEFINNSEHQLLVVSWTAQNNPNRSDALLVLPSLAEELNCCRRHVTELGHYLLNQSIDTYTVDYAGTGDSQGIFSELTLETMKDDFFCLLNHVSNLGYRNIHLLGIRMGGNFLLNTLDTVFFQKLNGLSLSIKSISLWDYIESPQLFINQLFRLKMAQLLAEGKRKSKSDLVCELQQNGVIEIAGYLFNKEFITQLEELNTVALPKSNFEQVRWHTFNYSESQISNLIEQNTETGIKFTHHNLPLFWMLHEAPVSKMLIEDTASQISHCKHSHAL